MKLKSHNPITCPTCLKEEYFKQTILYNDLTQLVNKQPSNPIPERFRNLKELSQDDFIKTLRQHNKELWESRFGQRIFSLISTAMQLTHKRARIERRLPTTEDFSEFFIKLSPKPTKKKKRLRRGQLRKYLDDYIAGKQKTLLSSSSIMISLIDCESCDKYEQCVSDSDKCLYDNDTLGTTQRTKRRNIHKAKQIIKNLEEGRDFPGDYK